jgi:hypothetical protein
MAWPQFVIAGTPSPARAHSLAATVRRAVGATEPRIDLRAVCRAGRFRVCEREMSAAQGGAEAMLHPEPGDRFSIWVDPTPRGGWDAVASELRPELRQHRLRFRVAHEVGHSFFFRRGPEPRRLSRGGGFEEGFVDLFARSLLVPPPVAAAVDPTPDGILALQAECDVSLEVAARAASDAQHLVVALFFWRAADDPRRLAPRVQWASRASAGDVESIAAAVRGAAFTSRSDRGGLRGVPGAVVLPRRRQVLVVRSPEQA